jgi:hypothetical protein
VIGGKAEAIIPSRGNGAIKGKIAVVATKGKTTGIVRLERAARCSAIASRRGIAGGDYSAHIGFYFSLPNWTVDEVPQGSCV